jgi:tetratricopeptide (TPR) repeat protein
MDLNTRIAALKTEIARGGLVVVAGTGVSVATCRNQQVEGFPVATWIGLLRHGVKHCRDIGAATETAAKVLNDQIGSGEIDFLVSAAETIVARMTAKSSGAFRGWLQETIGKLQIKDRTVIDALSGLSAVLATLNYDNLLEEATGGRAVTWLKADAVQNVLRGNVSNAIVHLHGWYDEPESVVLGFKSYLEVKDHPHAQTLLRLFTMSHTLLFVGCGDTVLDPNFTRLIEWGREALHDVAPRHVLLCRTSEVDEFRRKLTDAPWLEPLAYGDVYDELAPFLRELAPAVASLPLAGSAVVAVEPAGPPERPRDIPPHPDDTFAGAEAFIGRESLLGLAADAVDGLMERFRLGTPLTGARGIRLIWAHGFGGMGKSWFLHRIRSLAEGQHPQIRSLIVDWDKPIWLAPLTSEPRVALEVFDLLAVRLMQRFGVDAADEYWLAKARVEGASAAHKQAMDRFEGQVHLAGTAASEPVESHLRQLLDAENLWNKDPVRRARNIESLREDRVRYRNLFGAWCRETGETDSCVICPSRERAEGLRDAFRRAMKSHPLIVILDTCEVLSDDLDGWLRELFVPLFREPTPLLVLVGSRLRPDLHQDQGKFGWVPESPSGVLRVEDFGELCRFTVHEIKSALGKLRRPVSADAAQIAEVLHHVTLGIPLAVRGLLDLHEDGDPVLQDLSALDDDDIPLSERDAVRRVIGLVADRFLLNLQNHPEREDDLRDIIALAILPTFDHATMKAYWGNQAPKERLRDLARRYSLVSDGDLHPSVRNYLRRHWRIEENCPAVFGEVVDQLSGHSAKVAVPATTPAERVAMRAAELNLRSWTDGDEIVGDIARTLCLARLYEADGQLLESLLAELPLAGPANSTSRKLWHRDEEAGATDRAIVDWLRNQSQSSKAWTEEERAALDLLDGIETASRYVEPKVALAAIGMLERGMEFFGLETVPRANDVGEAYFDCAHVLDPTPPTKVDSAEWIEFSILGYERAISCHYLESVACNNVANLYRKLGEPEKAEQAYLKAIELDPNYATPHNGLGYLFQYYLGEPEKAEQAYLKAIELDPKDAYPHNGLGYLFQYHLGEPEKAEQAYLKAIELDPKSAYPHSGLGDLYLESQRWADASASFIRGATLGIKSGSGQRGLAWVALLSRDDFTEARQWAEQAAAIDAKHPGTPLVEMAVDVWAGEWIATRDRFATWVRELRRSDQFIVYPGRRRIAALLRKIQDLGGLAHVAEVFQSVVDRPCWQPWSEAVNAVLAGADRNSLSDSETVRIFDLLTEEPGIAPT